MKIGSTTFQILDLFAHDSDVDGFTIGEITQNIGAWYGTAVYQRMKCDLIGKGWDIRHREPKFTADGRHRYFMPYRERMRARRFLADLVKAQSRKVAA